MLMYSLKLCSTTGSRSGLRAAGFSAGNFFAELITTDFGGGLVRLHEAIFGTITRPFGGSFLETPAVLRVFSGPVVANNVRTGTDRPP
jgi:hypothetical protein